MATRRWSLVSAYREAQTMSLPQKKRNPFRSPETLRSLCCVAALLGLSLTFNGHCSDDSREQYQQSIQKDPGEYAGRYLIEPSRKLHYLTLKEDGTAISEKEGRRQIGFVQRDSRMLRIYIEDRDRPTGLFLLSDYSAKDWRGMWNNSVRILKKQP